jgi:large subunit ribosomal protein L25
LVPAIVYGKGLDPTLLSVDAHDLQTVLHTDAGTNAIITLEIEGGDTVTAMARVVERHPFRNEYRHIDFVTVDLTQRITADVNLHFIGTPAGVKEGGVFSPRRTSVQIDVLVTAIPSGIDLDVSEVEIGGSLRISDLPAIEDVEYLEDPEAVVMSVTHPAAEIVEEPVVVEGEELVEGEEPEDGEAEETAGSEDEQEAEAGE